MPSRKFSPWQKIAALAPLLFVASFLPGEIMVRCHVDGLLRPAPCCAHPEQAGDSGPAFKVRDCCDREARTTQRAVSEAVRATDEQIYHAVSALCPTAGALAAQARDLAGWSAQRDGPAREGPSIILVKHAFLI